MINIPNPTFIEHGPAGFSKSKWVRLGLQNFSVTQGDKVIGPAMREFIICRDAVAIIVYCPSARKILLSRQFRMPAMHALKDVEKAWIYEAIAGIVDDGENPVETAVREAMEEASVVLDPQDVRKIGTFFASPGISTERIHVYVCPVEDCVPEKPSGGLVAESEAILSEWVDYADVWALMDQGEIMDFKTYVALQSVLQFE